MEPKTQYEWRELLPTAYGWYIGKQGYISAACPMGFKDEYSVEEWEKKYPDLKFDISHGNNEDPCSYWFNVTVPVNLVRPETPLESAIRKVRDITFSPEERDALKEY